jgi:fatty-acid peroxygenase
MSTAGTRSTSARVGLEAVGARSIPRLWGYDHTLAMMRQPYDFISTHCRRLRSDVFRTRLLLRDTICMTGAPAAQVFYDPKRFRRRGAAPLRLQQSLLGIGGVQGLDGEAHADRKQMFLALMHEDRIEELAYLVLAALRRRASAWAYMEDVVLYDELQEPLTRAVCQWTGVPLPGAEVLRLTHDLSIMFDRAGAVGPLHWGARMARNRTERWLGEVIGSLREGSLAPMPQRAISQIALHRDPDGQLRATVAVSVYIVAMAHALHEHPDSSERVNAGDTGHADRFIAEVRRLYPFFPAIPALVRDTFEWDGYTFPAGTRTLLDLHGINHDPRLWSDPETFQPERFAHWQGHAFAFVPQGAGEHAKTHRCAGEWATIRIMQVVLDFLVQELSYSVPAQDLRIDRARLPALPRSRFVIRDVRLN